jgi:anthranilate synthase component 2
MVLMIDNYDSFTYNLVQYLGELGAEVKVVRNDEIDVEQALALNPERILISPGPCTPDQAGISVALIEAAAGRLPVLGVCLGHQSIGQAFGGQIVKAREVMHGKTSPIHHAGQGVFAGLANPLTATRYHSLVIAADSLPDCLEVTAWTAHADGEHKGARDEIMAVRHRDWPIEGVQFHPESISSEQGHELLKNFLES